MVLLASCVQSSTTTCSNGRVCAAGTHCDEMFDRCVSDEQQTACEGVVDGDSCTLVAGIGACQDGACFLPICGDGVRSGSERCENDDLGGATCASLGFYVTTTGLACDADCRFATGGCEQYCGDGIINGEEQCDGDAALGGDCTTAGYYHPEGLACTAFCTWNVESCDGKCGDGFVENGEVCDGSAPAAGCLSYRFDYGQIACALCGPGFSGCGDIGWRDETVGVAGFLSQVMATSTGVVWTVGDGVAARRDAGTWTTFTLPSQDTGKALWVRAEDDVFAGGSHVIGASTQPVVDHFDGMSWQRMVLPSVSSGFERIQDIVGLSTGQVYARSFEGFYELTGTTWTRRLTTTSPNSSALWAAAPDDVWLARNATRDVVRVNGTTLTPVPNIPTAASGAVLTMWGTDATHVFMGFSNGLAVLAGTAWTFMPTTSQVLAIHGASASDVIVSCSDGTVFHFDGTRLTKLVAGSDVTLGSVWHTGAEVLAAIPTGIRRLPGSIWLSPTGEDNGYDPVTSWVTDGAIFESRGSQVVTLDAQNAWVLVGGVAQDAAALWGFSATDLWALDSANSRLAHLTGTSWQVGPTFTGAPVALWGSTPTDLWYVTQVGSTATVSRGDGTTFAPIHTATVGSVVQLRGTSATDVWFMLGDNHVEHWNGSTWTSMTLPGIQAARSIWPISPTNVLVVGLGGAIARWNGTTWAAETAGTTHDLYAVWARSAGDVYAGGAFGTLLHHDGTTWSPVRDPRPGTASVQLIAGAERLVLFSRGDIVGGDVLYQLAPW